MCYFYSIVIFLFSDEYNIRGKKKKKKKSDWESISSKLEIK